MSISFPVLLRMRARKPKMDKTQIPNMKRRQGPELFRAVV